MLIVVHCYVTVKLVFLVCVCMILYLHFFRIALSACVFRSDVIRNAFAVTTFI